MKEIRIPLDWFNLDGFIESTLSLLKKVVSEECDPSYGITWSDAPGGYPHDGDEQGWDFKSKLMNDPVHLFFTFAYFSDDKVVDCADGNSYPFPWKNTGYWDPSQDEDEEEEDENDLPFTVEDLVGYLVRVEDGTISISSAISGLVPGMPPFKVGLLPDGDFLEKPLVNFIKGFVHGNPVMSCLKETASVMPRETSEESSQEEPDMKEQMKQRIKDVLMEDSGKVIDIVIYPVAEGDFSVVIDGYTEDWIKRRYCYFYSGWGKELTDTHIFIEGEGLGEEWTHLQKWGPITGMTREDAEKMFWDAVKDAKQELDSEGRQVKWEFLDDQRGAH